MGSHDTIQQHIERLRPIVQKGKHLFIIRGLPGSGKSTFASTLGKALGAKIHTTDDFHTDAIGNYKYEKHLAGQAHAWNVRRTEHALTQGHNVVVPNTSTTQAEMQPYLDMAKRHGAQVHVFRTSYPGKNVHNVPDDVLHQMSQRWEPYPGEIHLKPEEGVSEGLIEAKLQSAWKTVNAWHGSRVPNLRKFEPQYDGSGVVGGVGGRLHGGFFFTSSRPNAEYYTDPGEGHSTREHLVRARLKFKNPYVATSNPPEAVRQMRTHNAELPRFSRKRYDAVVVKNYVDGSHPGDTYFIPHEHLGRIRIAGRKK